MQGGHKGSTDAREGEGETKVDISRIRSLITRSKIDY